MLLLSCLFSSVEYSFSVCQERSPNGKPAPTKRSGDFSVPLLRKKSFVVTELTIRNVEHRAAVDLRPVGVIRKKKKFGLRIDKVPDQPRTRYPIDFNFFASDPFHDIRRRTRNKFRCRRRALFRKRQPRPRRLP